MMSRQSHDEFNLEFRSHQAMRDCGFLPDFSPQALAQSQSATINLDSPVSVDLRHLLWSSIDNHDSLDLDQIEAAEPLDGGILRVMVGIADVDSQVPIDTPIDQHAAHNKCSVYTGVAIYPMLPERLSTDITSLKQDVDREAIVVSMDVDRDGAVVAYNIFPALTRNRARLSYDEIGDWLEGRAPTPTRVAAVPGMEQQIRLQAEAANRLLSRRIRAGALDFDTIEAQPVMRDGRVVDLHVPRKNLARTLIENLMVSANTTMASFLEARGIASLQRVVRSPERWPRIVDLAARLGEHLPAEADAVALSQFLAKQRDRDREHFPDLSLSVVKLLGPGEYVVVRSQDEHAGHFGLAVQSYTHSTAPNRRFADVVIQRLLKALIHSSGAPYTLSELEEIGRSCTERENAARKVERLMRKVAAASMMRDRIGQVFEAIVTGASPKGTYVRLLSPPVEGRVTINECDLDVGDHARVRLVHADPDRGFIDFECL